MLESARDSCVNWAATVIQNALGVSSYPAQAMPAFGPSNAKVDGVVVKAYTYRRARVTTRRTARRVYRRHTYAYPY